MWPPPLGRAMTPPLMRRGSVTRPGTFAMWLLSFARVGATIIASAPGSAIAPVGRNEYADAFRIGLGRRRLRGRRSLRPRQVGLHDDIGLAGRDGLGRGEG